MRMKKKTWILTFESTTQAMAAEKYAMEQNLPGRLIPIPREITAGCGLSWKAVPEARDEILTALEKAGCHWEGEYILELKKNLNGSCSVPSPRRTESAEQLP